MRNSDSQEFQNINMEMLQQSYYRQMTDLSLCKMGNCVNKPKITTKIQPPMETLLKQQQIFMLELIYGDLSSRINQRKLNLENFLLFFQKNGLWGERLFRQFDFDQSQLISFQQFIKGICINVNSLAKIFKTTEDEKIKLLFSFFSKKSQKNKEGINFKQFLLMLYNYPKEDLKIIMQDADFFNTELKKNLILLEGRKQDNDLSKKKIIGRIDDEFSQRGASMVGQDIMKIFNLAKPNDMCLQININSVQIEVKTANIHNLVKRFAKNIFKDNKIDIQSGRLNRQQFQKWIIKHKNLYDNYYKGFHNQIWEFDQTTNKPRFISCPNERKQQARVLNQSFSIIKVKVFLFHSIIVISDMQQTKALKVICLQGLGVKKYPRNQYGCGIQITHRDGVYSPKHIYFKNDQIADSWVEVLKCFKGDSIHQLYEMINQIGTGKFSVVYQAKEKATNRKYAIKVIETVKLDLAARKLIAHESIIMAILQNPFLVYYKQTIQTKTNIYIVTQLVKGKDLFDLVKQNRYLSQQQTVLIAYQLISGVRYLHSLGIVHRDLKPENVMVSLSEEDQQIGSIKIIDFGFSNYLTSLKQFSTYDIIAGTPNYISPQMLKNQPISQKIDNFAIGAILYFSLCGKPPFNGYNTHQILHNTINGKYQYKQKIWSSISSDAKNFIDGLLQIIPQDRLSLDEALRHPWIVNNLRKTQADYIQLQPKKKQKQTQV